MKCYSFIDIVKFEKIFKRGKTIEVLHATYENDLSFRFQCGDR